MKLVLDTSVAGYLCHPRRHAEVKLWFRGVVGLRRHELVLPEVVDFELRRELLRLGSTAGLRLLDALPTEVLYLRRPRAPPFNGDLFGHSVPSS